jgi:transmembrane sensor
LETNRRRIVKLIAKKHVSALSEEEQRELDEWIASSPFNRQFYDQFNDEEYLARNKEEQNSIDTDASWKRFEQAYFNTTNLNKRKRSRRNTYLAVAASVLLIFSLSFFYWFLSSNKTTGKIIAIIKRSDGSILELVDSGKKILADVNGIQIINEGNGHLRYKRVGDNINTATPTIDTIITPIGGQCQVTLVDGTKVWLNAQSYLIFPTNLNDTERLVTLSGEGYFEVNPQSSPVAGTKIPFVVWANDVKVNVLGTHFNVMAYGNEQTTTTTLIEGSVKIETKDSTALLKPGQQAKVGKYGSLNIVKQVDVHGAVSWKDGEMKFEECPLDSIMRQAARWYDMEFVCEKNCSKLYGTTLLKKDSLKVFLQTLETTGTVHFNIDGKKIIAR